MFGFLHKQGTVVGNVSPRVATGKRGRKEKILTNENLSAEQKALLSLKNFSISSAEEKTGIPRHRVLYNATQLVRFGFLNKKIITTAGKRGRESRYSV